MSRARDTAAELARLTGLEVVTDPGLRETNGGRWEGLLAAEITKRDGDLFRTWRAGGDVRPGGGETREEVAARAGAAVARTLAALPEGGVLVVATHGGTARALIGRLLALPIDCWHALGGLANCSWSVLEEAGSPGSLSWRLTEHNAGTLPEPVTGTDDA